MPLFPTPDDAPDGLTRLMLLAVPEDRNGHKTLVHLSSLIGVSVWGMRKWINAQTIPARRAMDIVRISHGRVRIEDFHEYIYGTRSLR